MTEGTPPKRRGRPPGSKNKPKPTATTPPEPVIEVEPQHDFIDFEGPILTGSPFLPVVLQFGAGLSKQLDEQKIDWPQGWPLPNVHDRVVYSVEDKRGGTVVAINYRVDLGEIHILVT